jgi:hypothetical protein
VPAGAHPAWATLRPRAASRRQGCAPRASTAAPCCTTLLQALVRARPPATARLDLFVRSGPRRRLIVRLRGQASASASESAAAPSSPIWLFHRLQRGDEGQGCSWRDRAAGREQGARSLLQRRQRDVALERLRERRGARVTDLVAAKAAAWRGGSGMLAAGR